MKDKLFKFKLNKKKTDSIEVILACQCEDKFYDWLKLKNPLAESKIFSLKRLASMFLSEFPVYYGKYNNLEQIKIDEVRIARYNAYEDED